MRLRQYFSVIWSTNGKAICGLIRFCSAKPFLLGYEGMRRREEGEEERERREVEE